MIFNIVSSITDYLNREDSSIEKGISIINKTNTHRAFKFIVLTAFENAKHNIKHENNLFILAQ